MIKVTIEIDGVTSVIQDNDVGLGDNFGELYDLMRQAALGTGFGDQTVETWMEAR
jgi:hypothetical protein